MILEKKSKNEIWKELKSHPLEDSETTKAIEKILIKKRGYVFRMPKPKESVILLLSGGVDSIVMWDILISKYKLNVYPLFVTGKTGLFRLLDNQYRSMKYFERFYRKKYKNLLHPIYVAKSIEVMNKKIKEATLKNPQEIINSIHADGNINIQNYSRTTVLSCMALDYSRVLEIQKNIKISTIFTGNLYNDGLVTQNQTLTVLRSTMYNLCAISGDYYRQFTSLFMEKEMGYFFDKNFVVQWAKKYHLPISKTWTCWYREKLIPCGVCTTCRYRKSIMIDNDLKDVLYESDIKSWLLTVKHKIYTLIKERYL